MYSGTPYPVAPGVWPRVLAVPFLGAGSVGAHVAESPDEVMLLDEGVGPLVEAIHSVGRDPARWPGGGPGVVSRLGAGGALTPGLIAAHCVQVDSDDAGILAEHGVRVAHCPHSVPYTHLTLPPIFHVVGSGCSGLFTTQHATQQATQMSLY